MREANTFDLSLLILLAIIWGSAFFNIKIATYTYDPITLVFVRVFFAFIALGLYCAYKNIKIYDDFAHHPTAIRKTIDGVREASRKELSADQPGRLIVVFEPRSNSLKRGVGKQQLADCFKQADMVHVYSGSVSWDVKMALSKLGEKVYVERDIQNILRKLLSQVEKGDSVVFMSNGDFHGIISTFVEMLDSVSI